MDRNLISSGRCIIIAGTLACFSYVSPVFAQTGSNPNNSTQIFIGAETTQPLHLPGGAFTSDTTPTIVPAPIMMDSSAGGIVTQPAPLYGTVNNAVSGTYSPPPAPPIHFTLNTPEKAKVFVNGDPTASEGAIRYYVVNHLEIGRTYKFEFAVEIENPAGVILQEKKTLTLSPGAREALSFKPFKKKKVAKPDDESGESDSSDSQSDTEADGEDSDSESGGAEGDDSQADSEA